MVARNEFEGTPDDDAGEGESGIPTPGRGVEGEDAGEDGAEIVEAATERKVRNLDRRVGEVCDNALALREDHNRVVQAVDDGFKVISNEGRALRRRVAQLEEDRQRGIVLIAALAVFAIFGLVALAERVEILEGGR